MNNSQIDFRDFTKQHGVTRTFGGVNNYPAAGYRLDGKIKPCQVGEIGFDILFLYDGTQPRIGNWEKVLGTPHQMGEPVDFAQFKLIKAAKCLLYHGRPERALAKWLAAATQLVFGKALFPDIPHLTY